MLPSNRPDRAAHLAAAPLHAVVVRGRQVWRKRRAPELLLQLHKPRAVSKLLRWATAHYVPTLRRSAGAAVKTSSKLAAACASDALAVDAAWLRHLQCSDQRALNMAVCVSALCESSAPAAHSQHSRGLRTRCGSLPAAVCSGAPREARLVTREDVISSMYTSSSRSSLPAAAALPSARPICSLAHGLREEARQEALQICAAHRLLGLGVLDVADDVHHQHVHPVPQGNLSPAAGACNLHTGTCNAVDSLRADTTLSPACYEH